MTKNQKRLAAVGAVLALIAVLICLFDWNMLRGPVERRVEQATGRSFHIHGDMDVKLSWYPHIIVNNVVLGNAAWSRNPAMLRLQQADITLDLRSIWRDVVVIPHVQLQAPRLLLEKNAAGAANWQFPQQQGAVRP